MNQRHDSGEDKVLGFNNVGVDIIEIREEDTTPEPPSEALRNLLEARYGKPKGESPGPVPETK
jgi:hypothetical protein